MTEGGVFRRSMLIGLAALFLAGIPGLSEAAEYQNGQVRLSLNEHTGRFSLYYITDTGRIEPFFSDVDSRTSFLSVMVNDRIYKMGETTSFSIRLGGTDTNPALLFETPTLRVTQEFSFIRTAPSLVSNGIRMNIRVENRGTSPVQVGIRFLLDTNLGEFKDAASHFSTDRQTITTETIINGISGDQWWISRNNQFTLMGSIASGVPQKPDQIYFSTWKRLNDASWKITNSTQRNFNNLISTVDSALCYYFDPAPIAAGGERSVSILLTAEDRNGFSLINTPTESPIANDEKRTDLSTIRELLTRIDGYISGYVSGNEPGSDLELIELERIISGLKDRYPTE